MTCLHRIPAASFTIRRIGLSRLSLSLLMLAAMGTAPCGAAAPPPVRVGIATVDITPPVGFPMAGYYHERLAEGTLDPLSAKAIVFRSDNAAAALVVCDLIGVATDLSREVRRRAAEQTGIPESHIVLAATHSHTAPDYMKELYLRLGGESQDEARAAYIDRLIDAPVQAIAAAWNDATPAVLKTGIAVQEHQVSFNRRFVMLDGSVRTWMRTSSPDVVRAAGPIDPEIGLLAVCSPDDDQARCLLTSFALHLDTVGGTRWSADYPRFIEQTVQEKLGTDVASIFATGTCGDINHVDPSAAERNSAEVIGRALGETICRAAEDLAVIESADLVVRNRQIRLPLEEADREEVRRSVELLKLAQRGEKIEFFDHVLSYKKVMLDHFRHPSPFADSESLLTWGLSRSLAGVGDAIPVDVTVIALGNDAAIVCLPGEVFVELGLSIRQASPFRTTMVVELSNCVETIYIPHRAAYAGGSYEVTNSALQPGGGELLVETAVSLLREAAAERTGAGQP